MVYGVTVGRLLRWFFWLVRDGGRVVLKVRLIVQNVTDKAQREENKDPCTQILVYGFARG